MDTATAVHLLGASCTQKCVERADYVLSFNSDGTWSLHAAGGDEHTFCGWGNSAALKATAWADIPDVDDPRERVCIDCFTADAIELLVGAL